MKVTQLSALDMTSEVTTVQSAPATYRAEMSLVETTSHRALAFATINNIIRKYTLDAFTHSRYKTLMISLKHPSYDLRIRRVSKGAFKYYIVLRICVTNKSSSKILTKTDFKLQEFLTWLWPPMPPLSNIKQNVKSFTKCSESSDSKRWLFFKFYKTSIIISKLHDWAGQKN